MILLVESIERTTLCEFLLSFLFRGNIVDFIRELWSNRMSSVFIDGVTVGWLSMKPDERQGCTLGPYLF